MGPFFASFASKGNNSMWREDPCQFLKKSKSVGTPQSPGRPLLVLGSVRTLGRRPLISLAVRGKDPSESAAYCDQSMSFANCCPSVRLARRRVPRGRRGLILSSAALCEEARRPLIVAAGYPEVPPAVLCRTDRDDVFFEAGSVPCRFHGAREAARRGLTPARQRTGSWDHGTPCPIRFFFVRKANSAKSIWLTCRLPERGSGGFSHWCVRAPITSSPRYTSTTAGPPRASVGTLSSFSTAAITRRDVVFLIVPAPLDPAEGGPRSGPRFRQQFSQLCMGISC